MIRSSIKQYFLRGLWFISLCLFKNLGSLAQDGNYQYYHEQVNKAQELIATQAFGPALSIYDQLFKDFEFIFLRDYHVAAQIALSLRDTVKTKAFLERALAGGWTKRSLRKNRFLSTHLPQSVWMELKTSYPQLKKQNQSRLNQSLRSMVKKMFIKDQRKAFKALFFFSDKSRTKYAVERFAPHSEEQMTELLLILSQYGFPSEQLIGNDFWAATILSHHNSISTAYNQSDTLFLQIRPRLKIAWLAGQISAFELALINAWYIATTNEGTGDGYGILFTPDESDLDMVDRNRMKVGLCTIAVRNKLLALEKSIGMQFYLEEASWIE